MDKIELTSAHKLFLYWLISQLGEDPYYLGRIHYVKDIAQDLSVSQRSVRRMIAELSAMGVIKVTRHWGSGKEQHANEYAITSAIFRTNFSTIKLRRLLEVAKKRKAVGVHSFLKLTNN